MPTHEPDRGHAGRPGQADPARAPRLRREHPDRGSACRRSASTSPAGDGVLGWLHSVARSHVEVALAHPVRLIANALGPPPPDVIDQAHEHGLIVAALAGRADARPQPGRRRRRHRGGAGLRGRRAHRRDRQHGADPGDRRRGRRSVPVLAAGGIGCGRQIAAALALGARGVWMGSMLAHHGGVRSQPSPALREALLAAGSSRHGASADLLRQAGPAAAQPVDRGVERAGGARRRCRCRCRTCWSPEAHSRLMRVRRPDRGADAGRPDRGPDERGPPGRRGDGRPGGRGRRDPDPAGQAGLRSSRAAPRPGR